MILPSVRHRAIDEQQKQDRRQAILTAALTLFQAATYEAVSMAAVAEGAGVAKGTLYLYFKTKEALFLALQAEAFTAWFARIDTFLRATSEPLATQTVVAFMVDSLAQQKAFLRLIAILHTTLEHNIDFATALAFKQTLRTHILQTGALLEARLSFLYPGNGAQLLLRLYALVIGLQHLSDPAPMVQQTLAEPGLDLFKVDFYSELSATLGALVQGFALQSLGEG